MASFRVSAAIVGTLPGVAPPAVLDAARDAVAQRWHVEDSFVDVQPLALGHGPPRVTVRLVVPTGSDPEEDAAAWHAAKALATGLSGVAVWTDLRVFRRVGGRWERLDGPQPRSAGDGLLGTSDEG